jgi:hypothetical protein
MTKANFVSWARTTKGGEQHTSSFKKLKNLLYGEDASNENGGMFILGVDDHNVNRVIPMGYIALVKLMMKKGKDLFGLAIDYNAANGACSSVAIPLGAIIGSGSTSIVFSMRKR